MSAYTESLLRPTRRRRLDPAAQRRPQLSQAELGRVLRLRAARRAAWERAVTRLR